MNQRESSSTTHADIEPLTDAPVSVVIPCYRCESTIGRALQSVLTQTRPPNEIILVDDASPDHTWAVIERLAAQDPSRITAVRLAENAGAASARNVGWNQATQPYVAFLDSDDAWHPHKLEWQHAFMAQHPSVDVSGHLFTLIKPGKDTVSENLSSVFPSKKIQALSLLLKNPFVTPSVMLKRSIPIRFLEGRRHMEDHLLWVELALSGYSVRRLEVPLAFIYKPSYGASGLSGQMLQMQRSDSENYFVLYRNGRIGWPLKTTLQAYSWLKYFRRLTLVFFRKIISS